MSASPVAITAANIRTAIEECRRNGKARDIRVEGQRGLYLRISAAGVGSWSLVYRIRGTETIARYFLGRYPETTLKDARDMAAAWMPRVDQGIDPRDVRREEADKKAQAKERARAEAEAKAARISVADAVEAFILAKKKNRTADHLHYYFGPNVTAHYGTKALADLTRKDVEDIHARIVARGAPRQADLVLANVRSLLSWAVKKRHVTENVASKFEHAVSHGEGIRDRKLNAAEIRALWLLLESEDCGIKLASRRIIKLAVLLGSRASEVSGMHRSELSPDVRFWTIPADRMKAKRMHLLPLPPAARQIIIEALADAQGDYVFAIKNGKPPLSTSTAHSMSKLQDKLAFKDARGEANPITMHDLRRTVGTGLQQLGVPMDVVKAVLAHSALDDVTKAHYAQSTLGREVHEALTRWQAAVTSMVRGEDPFAIREEDFADKERRILGQDQAVTAEPASAPNVVPLRAAV